MLVGKGYEKELDNLELLRYILIDKACTMNYVFGDTYGYCGETTKFLEEVGALIKLGRTSLSDAVDVSILRSLFEYRRQKLVKKIYGDDCDSSTPIAIVKDDI